MLCFRVDADGGVLVRVQYSTVQHRYCTYSTQYIRVDSTVNVHCTSGCAQVDETKVASLLRLEYNMCNVDECEKELKRRQKFNELLIFYKSRKLHSKGTPPRLASLPPFPFSLPES